VSWSGDATGAANPVSVTVSATRNVTAAFALNAYTLTINKIGQGNVSKSPNSATYTHGTIVTLSANPSGSWRFAGWSGDTTATSNPLALPMIANRTVTAKFVESQAPIVVTTAPNGGETLTIGTTATLTWIASDNIAVTAVDVLLSRDGLATFDTLAAGIANSGSFDWVVTGPATSNAYVEIRAYDAAGNSAVDPSDAPIKIVQSTAAVETGAVTQFALAPITPNPARGAARVLFAVPRASWVKIAVLDVQGRTVAVLAEGERPAGRHEVRWDASGQPAGFYFVRFEGGGRRLVRRVALTH
jgi:hypothetical protein